MEVRGPHVTEGSLTRVPLPETTNAADLLRIAPEIICVRLGKYVHKSAIFYKE